MSGSYTVNSGVVAVKTPTPAQTAKNNYTPPQSDGDTTIPYVPSLGGSRHRSRHRRHRITKRKSRKMRRTRRKHRRRSSGRR